MSTEQVNILLAILTIAGQASVVLTAAILLFYRKNNNQLINYIIRNGIPLAFLAALISTGGSLYYSEVAGLTPCDLCWFQRIFMYPQVVLLGLAWWKKDRNIIDYSLILLGIGTLISLYHNYIYYTAKPSLICSISSPCTQKYVVGFGDFSVSLMALTAFILMTLLLLNKKMQK